MPHQGTLVFTDGTSAPLMALHFAPQAGNADKRAKVTLDVVLAAQTAGEPGFAPGFTFALRDVSVPQSGLALAALNLTGKLAASRDSVTLSLTDCGIASGLAFAQIRLDSARICAPDRPFLSLAAAAREAIHLVFALKQAQMRWLAANGTPRLSGLLPELAVTIGSDLSAEQLAFSLKAEGGALTGPAALAIRDITLSADAGTTDGRLTGATFALSRAIVSGIGTRPWLAPITFTGAGQTQASQFRFALDGAGGGVARLVQAEGKADFNGSTGEAHVTLPPLQLGAGTFAPEGLFPGLASRMSQATGKISAEARYAWGAEGVHSGGTMSLASVGANLPQGQVAGLSGTLVLSGLVPLATASSQVLRVARLDLGLPLTDGLLRFSIDPGGEARIHEGHLNGLGGTVGISSGMLSLTGKPQSLTFALDSIDLEQLLELAKVKGLSGTGRISGRIPVTIANGHQIVNGGTLSADAPGGTLVYKTGQARANPTNPSTLLYTALDDFHYETLTGDLSGDLAGLLSLRVHLKGRNPALYDGRQVELNVSTEGAFVDMVRKSLYGYRAP
jgi:hypothetical protein